MSDKVRTWILGVVTAVWTANYVLPGIFDTYQPNEAINGIFMAIVGGTLMIKSKKDQEDDDD